MTNDLYKTRDLAESAVLLVCKQHLIQIQRVGKICWFIFEDQQACAKISSDYFFGELLINAREFHQAITRLKNRIFARV
jgi:hypothetical protein